MLWDEGLRGQLADELSDDALGCLLGLHAEGRHAESSQSVRMLKVPSLVAGNIHEYI